MPLPFLKFFVSVDEKNGCRTSNNQIALNSGLVEAVARVEAQANSEPNRTTGLPPDALFMREKESLRPIGNLRLLESMVGDVSVQTVPPTMLVRAAGREWSVPRRCIGRRVSVIAMPGGQVVVRMAGEEVAVHDAASGPLLPLL